MSGAARKVAIVLGIADAQPLRYIGGAANSARAFHDWASALGYQSTLVTDEDAPVTMQRLRDELELVLRAGLNPIHRLVIYFAGHGLIREAEEGLWLLSDWSNDLRAVAVESLKRRLYMHDIRQIAIFADACRSLPPNFPASDLTPDAVLGRGPVRAQAAPAIDKFIAAQDGEATYVIPGATPKADRCLFSGVLLEGLWGTKPAAFSTILKDKITSRSLGTYLQSEVPRIAARYKCSLNPNVSPTFPEGEDVYFGEGAPPSPPAFPEWPPPEAVAGMGSAAKDADLPGSSLPEELGHYRAMPKLLWPAFDPRTGQAGQGGAFGGDESIKQFWTGGGAQIGLHKEPAPCLVEFANGLFAALTVLPGFAATIRLDERGVSALAYQPRDLPPEMTTATDEAIARLERGALRASDAADLAVDLRRFKHVDPVLGVISAYLYDSIGDTDSIRRMAYYYVQHDQAIPYDIALLALLQGERRGNVLGARIPAVGAREPRTERETGYAWTYSATPEKIGVVGGLWPWMRQGWTFLDDPEENGSTLILPGLIELTRYLRPGRFATFDVEGGRRLASLFGLQPSPSLDLGVTFRAGSMPPG